METFYKSKLSSLYNGDCVEVMKDLLNNYGNGLVDKVITSPPYNIIRNNSLDRCYDFYKDDKENNDYIEWVINIFDLYDKLLKKNGCVLWNMSYGSENTELMNLCIAEILKRTNFTLADILIWKKQSAIPNNVSNNKMTRICEFVYVFCRRNEFYTFTTNKKQISTMQPTGQAVYENVFNFFEAKNNDEATDLNRATFSTDFVNNLINRYVLNTDVVLDNFSGTGTTMFACESRDIKGIYIELSKEQCEYSKDRLKSIKQNLFF